MTTARMWREHWLGQALYARRTHNAGGLLFAQYMLRNIRRRDMRRFSVTVAL